jgi:hypothetical protein
VLIVAPQKTLKTAWLDDLAEFYPEVTAELIRGTADPAPQGDRADRPGETQIGIIGWDALKTHTRFEAQPGHALKKCEACGGLRAVRGGDRHRGQVPGAREGAQRSTGA